MSKIGAILNFADNTVTIDKIELPMRSHDTFMDIKAINTQFWELLEPIALREATNCTVEILDAKYEKSDLALIIAPNCTHLSASQQQPVLMLPLEYQDSCDGIVVDWQTQPLL